MPDNDPTIQFVAADFVPPDQQSRCEVAAVRWLAGGVNFVDNIYRWFAAHPLILCIVWSIWLSFLYFGLGSASYVKVPDCGNGTLPARMIIAQQFCRGELGNWMGCSGCGIDRVINNYRLEPPCILLALLPGWLGYGSIIWLQRFIACYFMLRVTRDDLGFTPRVAVLVAMSYSLFHQIGIHWQWDGFTLYDGLGIPGLPLLLWITNRLTERRILSSLIAALATGMALALCAPFFQTLFFPFLALFWYSCIQPAWTWKRFTLLTCIFIGWAGINFPEMLAAAKYVPESHRTEIIIHSGSPYVKYIENVQYWAYAVFTSNKPYLLCSLLGLLCVRLRDKRLLIVLAAIGGVLVFVRNYYAIYDHTLANMGILASFHFHRLIYLAPFLCSIAMGLGLMAIPAETVLQFSNRVTGLQLKVRPLLLSLLSLVLLYQSGNINAQRWRQIFRGENYRSMYEHPDLLDLVERTKHEGEFRVACISDLWRPGLGMHDSADWSISPGICWAYGFDTTDGYQVLYSKRYKHYWSQVLHPLLTHDSIRMQQHDYWANMVFLWHPALTQPAEMKFNEYYNLPLLSLANTRYLISPVPLHDDNLTLLPSSYREVLLKRKGNNTKDRISAAIRSEWNFKPLYIYENKQYLPRYFLTSQVETFEDEFGLLARLRSANAAELSQTILLLQADVPSNIDLTPLTTLTDTKSNAADKVQLVYKSSDCLEFEIETAGPSMFFLSSAYHPAWQAELNGAATKILPAQLAFQGIYLPAAGKHRLILRYKPLYSPATYFPNQKNSLAR